MAIPRKSDDRALLVRLDSDEIVALDYLRQVTRSSRAATVGWAIMEMCYRLGVEGRIRASGAVREPEGGVPENVEPEPPTSPIEEISIEEPSVVTPSVVFEAVDEDRLVEDEEIANTRAAEDEKKILRTLKAAVPRIKL